MATPRNLRVHRRRRQTRELITLTDAADLLGETREAVLGDVRSGYLRALHATSGASGGRLWLLAADVEAIRSRRAA